MKHINFCLKLIICFFIFFSSVANSEPLKKIKITGNDRITDETIKLFINVNINDDIDENKLNLILNDLYETNYFKDISLNFDNQILLIKVSELPIIKNIFYEGIKSNTILEILKEETLIKSRSSYNENLIKKEKLKIEFILNNLGYYNSNMQILVEDIKNNLVNITYKIDLGKKSKIKKITFIGNKIFKDKKLRRVITSSEYKFWKLISGRKYLNQN